MKMRRLRDESHRGTICEGLSKRGQLADTISKNTTRKRTKLYCQWRCTGSSTHNHLEIFVCLRQGLVMQLSLPQPPESWDNLAENLEVLWFYVLANAATGPPYKLSSSPRRAARLPAVMQVKKLPYLASTVKRSMCVKPYGNYDTATQIRKTCDIKNQEV